jgi:anti-sigma B factor antagonist
MVRHDSFKINQTAEKSGVRLSIEGELDMRTIGELSDRVAEQIDSGATELMLDLRQLTFMDSSGLRLLIELHDRSRQDGWRLSLLPPQHEAAALVLRTTGADKALPFEEASWS